MSEPASDRFRLHRLADPQANAQRAMTPWRGPYPRVLARGAFLAAALTFGPAAAAGSIDPLRFFVGGTETSGMTKVLMHKPMRTSSIGHGQLRSDGSLILVQRVQDEGRAPYVRQWEIRQIGPGRFAGTMSQASGPVAIVQVGDRYRFTFTMKGGMSVEQWLTPLPGGLSATSNMTVRKFGIAVASSTAIVKKTL